MSGIRFLSGYEQDVAEAVVVEFRRRFQISGEHLTVSRFESVSECQNALGFVLARESGA